MKFCLTPLTIWQMPTAITAIPTPATSTRPNGRAISRADSVSSASPDAALDPASDGDPGSGRPIAR